VCGCVGVWVCGCVGVWVCGVQCVVCGVGCGVWGGCGWGREVCVWWVSMGVCMLELCWGLSLGVAVCWCDAQTEVSNFRMVNHPCALLSARYHLFNRVTRQAQRWVLTLWGSMYCCCAAYPQVFIRDSEFSFDRVFGMQATQGVFRKRSLAQST
jgi:hypothetical protein